MLIRLSSMDPDDEAVCPLAGGGLFSSLLTLVEEVGDEGGDCGEGNPLLPLLLLPLRIIGLVSADSGEILDLPRSPPSSSAPWLGAVLLSTAAITFSCCRWPPRDDVRASLIYPYFLIRLLLAIKGASR